MADGAAGTPGSSTSKAPAAKDKECPYCHQAFTSSSLGRHLDLYIKEKNAKPPDDVHNVDEIRRLRGNVTRRQARTSSGKREISTSSSPKPTSFRNQGSPSLPDGYGSVGHGDPSRIQTYLNKATWQATGVINDIPSASDNTQHGRRSSPLGGRSVKEEIMNRQNAMEGRDRARAAELALQEVLGSVKAATMRAHPSSPFDFNFFTLSFPELCLRCLSAPYSLLAGSSIPDKLSWTTDAPQAVQLTLLREWLGSRLRTWRRQRQPVFAHGHIQPNGANGHLQDQTDSNAPSEVEEKYYQHLSKAYDTWKLLSEKHKQERWREECAKAFAREQEQHQETKRKLDLAEQEIQHLRSRSDQIHYPPEFNTFSPLTLPLSREAAVSLNDSDAWSPDALISKWKARIQSSRSQQHALPAPTPWVATPPPNLNTAHLNGNSVVAHFRRGDQRPYHNDYTASPSDKDEDLADAPGEEEELDNGHNQHQTMDKGMLDPHLRDENNDGEADGEGHVGGAKGLMGLREYNAGEGSLMDMGR